MKTKRFSIIAVLLLAAIFSSCALGGPELTYGTSSTTTTKTTTTTTSTSTVSGAIFTSDDQFSNRDLKQSADLSNAKYITLESGSDVTMKMTMQYELDGEKYDEVALATAKSGEWLTLENPAYTIPEGAEKLQLYLESPDSLTDFYIDEVSGAEKSA
jgi:archaellin